MRIQNFGNIEDLTSNIKKNPDAFREALSRNASQSEQPEDNGPFFNAGLKAGKMASMVGARGLSAAASWPGGLLSIAPDIGHWVAPETIPSYEQLQKKTGWLPQTPEQFHNTVIKGLVGSALDPKGAIEKNTDEGSKIFFNMITPGAALGKTTAASLGLTAKMAGAGQGAKAINEKLGGPGWLGEVASLGTQFGVGLLQNYVDTMKFAKNIRGEMLNEIHPNAAGNIVEATAEGEALTQKFQDLAKADKPAMEAYKTVKGFVDDTLGQKASPWGSAPVETAPIHKIFSYRDSLSDAIKRTPASERKYLLQAYNYVNKTIGTMLEKDYPEQLAKFKLSNEIFAADMNKSIINKLFGEHPGIANLASHPVTQKLLGLGGLGTAVLKPGAAPYVAGAFAASKLYDAGKLIMGSPYAMNAFKNVVKSAIPGKINDFASAVSTLDKAVNNALKVQNLGVIKF